jgi:hypothetical protein
VLQQDVIANGVDVGSEALGLENLSIAQGDEKTGKGFLADIFDGFGRIKAGAQLDFDERAEIGGKMLLRAEVRSPQAAQIGFVKWLELQVLASCSVQCEEV